MKILISICLLISAGLTSYAQEILKGRVVDASGEPVPYANVAMLSKADSTIVSGTVTGEDGTFSIASEEDRILMVAMLGYETMYLTPSENMTVKLKEDSAMLEGAVSVGMMVKTRATATSMVTEVKGTVLGSSGSVLEMLGKVPGMISRGDELEVLGKGSPVIYINGRKLQDMNELKQMRSEDVQSVEVINNPGAQYDASVSAVVRIRTVRREGEGFGFDLNAANNQDLQNGVSDPSATLNLRHRFRNLDLFGSVSYWKWDQISIYKDHVKMYTDRNAYVQEDCVANDHFYSSGLNYNLGFNWQLSDNHSVGARVVMRETVDAGTYYSSVTDILRHDESSGSVLEMLGKVPGMISRGDELEVLGKGSPVIYINGRKLHDMNELKQMRSEEVQSVEVINNPGAQYDASVSAVVRIRTVRREGEGLGFDLNAANNQDLQNGVSDPSATLNLRHRFRNLDLFGSVNYWKWDQISVYKDHVKMYTDRNAYVQEDCVANEHYYSSGLDYNLGFNWQFKENHSVGARLVRRTTVDAGTYWRSVTDILRYDESSGLVSSLNESSQDEKRNSPYDWEGNLYYSGQLGRLGISFNADYLSNRKDMICNISDIIDDAEHVGRLQEGVTASRLAAARLVLTYPVWKGQLETGAEVTSVERGNSYSITNYPLPASDSKVDENNVSAFASYGFSLPNFGSVSAGLRYEHVGFNYMDLLDDANSMVRYQDEFFPSLSWSRQFGSVQTSLAYSLRTSRPGYDDLSDRIKYINSFTLMQGDPKLKNERKQEIGMNARYRWLNLSVSYERIDNALTQMFNIYGKDNMLLVKRSNLSRPVRNLLVFLSANPTWGVYSPLWSAGMQKPWTRIEFEDPRAESGKVNISYTKPMLMFTFNNAFRFRHSWQLEANMHIQTKGDYLNFRMTTSRCNLGFVVQKCWLKNDALCLRVSVQDVLKRSLQSTYSNAGFLIHTETPVRNNHRLDVSLRYTFNASKSRYKGTGAGKDAQSRM